MKNSKGITLISLVITIVVILILAMISIGMLMGENGIISKADEATEETKRAKAEEQVKLAVAASYEGTEDLNDKILVDELYKISNDIKDINEIQVEKDIEDLTNRYAINVIVDGYGFEIEENGGIESLGKSSGSIPTEELSTSLGDGKWTGTVNEPKLHEQMTPVAWDDANQEIVPTTSEQWYNYEEQEGTTDGGTSRWANAKTQDGSYWVWIPRFEYKITYNSLTNKSAGGKIEVNLIPVSKTTPTTGYKIHPAFENGTDNDFKNGEWDEEVPGIWIMKFEASPSSGTYLTSYSSIHDPRSKPNAIAWRNISIGQSYSESIQYNPELGSHLIKNSEWGAVVYLAHSSYGRNGAYLSKHYNSMFYTGNGNYINNVIYSTTKNVYGVYDLSGGAGEFVAAYLGTKNSGNYLNNGTVFANSTAGIDNYFEYNTKYVTIYPFNDNFGVSGLNTYSTYLGLSIINSNYGYGDATIETSSDTVSTKTSWFSGQSNFFQWSTPFMYRGYWNSSFGYTASNGDDHPSFGFRVVLIF